MDIIYLFGYFVKLIGFFSFCLFLGILVKRSAFAIGFLFIWYVFEKILMHMIEIPQKVADFLPLESMYNLIKEPISRFKTVQSIESQLSDSTNIRDYSVHWYSLLIVLVWILIFIFLSYKLLKRRDL